MTFSFFMQNLVNALQWGSFYALIALGYSMVYSILMLFNFTHVDIFMTGSYIGFGVATAAHYASNAYVLSWPSMESGALPLEGGVAVAFHREIAAAPDPEAKRRIIGREFVEVFEEHMRGMSRLVEVTSKYIPYLLRKAEIIDALAAAPRGLDRVLELLRRDELKAICRTANIDDSGRSKARIAERILGLRPGGGTATLTKVELAEEVGEDSEVAKRATDFAGKLVPQGATLSEIANEPPKMLSKLTTVSSIIFHSEGPPTQSCYDVVDEMEKLIDAEIEAWRAFSAKHGK